MAQVDFIVAVILGIFQGLVEWLPISSSGQTLLAMVDILNIETDTALSLAFYLHFGTLCAVVLKMRMDVWHILSRLPRYRDEELIRFLLISTLLTGLVGIPVYALLVFFIQLGGGEIITVFVGIFLVLTGFIIYFSKKKGGTRSVGDSGIRDSILAGVAQGFAVIPGISRSGVTVAALVANDFDQSEALRISFLMSIPAILGIIMLEAMRGGAHNIGLLPILTGIAAAFIVGYVMIDVLMKFARKVKFDSFCIVFGAIAMVVGIALLI